MTSSTTRAFMAKKPFATASAFMAKTNQLLSTMARLRLLLVMFLTLTASTAWGEEEVVYTLTPASGSNNSYAGNCDVTIDDIKWNLTGNSTTTYWRIGGKSITNVDRALYSKTEIQKDISKIVISHGAASSITVNSVKLIVSTAADGAGTTISTLSSSFSANSTMTFTRPAGTSWANAYYKFVYNVTVSGGSNKYVEFKEAKFYAEMTPAVPFIVTLMDDPENPLEESSAGAGVFLPSRESCDGYTFAGWTKSWNDPQTTWTTTAPTIIPTGSYTPTANESLYPVYTKTEGGGTAYEKATTLTEGVYVMVSEKTSGTYKYMPNTTSSSSNPTLGSGITMNSGKTSLTNKITEEMLWDLTTTGTANQYYLRPHGSTTIGLGCTSSTGANIRISTSYKDVKWTITTSSNYGWQFKSNASTAMYLAVYTDDNWRNYTSSTTNQNGKFYLFKQTSSSTTSYISVPDCTTEPSQLATPTGLNVTNITSTSATLSWGEVANASSYLVTIVDGGDLSADIPNTQTSHTFEGLTPSTEYLWTVKAIGDGITYTNSEESETAEFTTLPAGYTITYNTNGGDAIPAASGTALPNPLPIPTKEHYEFQGWFTDEDCTQAATAGTTINADITLYAKWEAVTYTITLIPNYPNSLTGVFKDKEGNVIADNLVIPIKYGTESQLLTNFYSTLSLEGYQFDAFYTKVEGGQRRVRTGNLEEDLILYARWKQEYTITWNVLGAETGTTTIVEGQEWTLPEVDESCNDKQFVGWTTTPILEEQNEAPATLYTETNQFPLETNTYYAVFANVEVTGTGEYVKLTEALTDYSGEYLIVYEEGSRAFNGGLEESLLNGNDNYIPIAISDDVVQATDEVENARFIVAKVDGGYSIQSASGLYIGRSVNDNGMEIAQTYNENLVNTFPNCSTIQGKGGADIQYNNNTNPSQQNRFRYYASSLNTIALYKKTGTNMTNYTTSCVPTYTITWKNEDGTILETDENVENGATPSYDGETPTKAADAQYTYTFAGWTPEITTVTGDATYTATYTKTINKYTVTWKNEDGTTLETDENVQYGETPSYNGTTPTKAETAQYTYTFNAWTPAISTVTGDAIYTAKFDASINHYTVTFEMNGHGTAPATQTIAYGSKVSEPSAPTADGYEFAGWYKDEQCTIPWNFNTDIVTGNTTIHAKWLQIFTITWKANGLEYKTTNVTEGDLITPPDSPDLGDYCGQVFAGWTTAEMEETTNVAPTLYPNPTPFPTATEETPTTFYAVFADYDEQQ